jgi:hypothetical protein
MIAMWFLLGPKPASPNFLNTKFSLIYFLDKTDK